MDLRGTWSMSGLLSSVRGGPLSTRSPRSFKTSSVLKAASSRSVNQTRTWVGAILTVLPTRGSARSRKAWPDAALDPNSSAVTTRVARSPFTLPAKERPSQRVREEIIEEEVDLAADAHVLACPLVHRHDCFEPELEIFTRPDDTGVHRARRLPREPAIERVTDVDLHERDEPVDDHGQPHVPNERLKIGQAVHDGKAPLEDIGVLLDLHLEIAVVVDGELLVVVAAREHNLDDARDGKGAEAREA